MIVHTVELVAVANVRSSFPFAATWSSMFLSCSISGRDRTLLAYKLKEQTRRMLTVVRARKV